MPQEPLKARCSKNGSFDPAKAVWKLYSALGTWREVAVRLGEYSPAYWHLVAHGRRPNRRAENLLRRWFGLYPKGVRDLWAMRTEDLAWYLKHRRSAERRWTNS
jgi:hypothetical protein